MRDQAVEHFGLAAGKFSVVPFLLTNIWDFTGSEIMGFKVVDFSYLPSMEGAAPSALNI